MPRVDYSQYAEKDFVGIAESIARDKPEAARRWIQKLRDACMTPATQPEMGEMRPRFGVPGCRSFSVGNCVIFLKATQAGIEVARIVHGNRDMQSF